MVWRHVTSWCDVMLRHAIVWCRGVMVWHRLKCLVVTMSSYICYIQGKWLLEGLFVWNSDKEGMSREGAPTLRRFHSACELNSAPGRPNLIIPEISVNPLIAKWNVVGGILHKRFMSFTRGKTHTLLCFVKHVLLKYPLSKMCLSRLFIPISYAIICLSKGTIINDP